VVFGPQSPADIDVTTLNSAGTYTLLVEGRSYQGGGASFTFNVQPVVDDSAPLTLGARTDGAIAHSGQQDRFSLRSTPPSAWCSTA
jgi:hypothetical protein